jgi:hypothetical protein
MPASLHGFNGPEVVSRFAELAGLWQAVPQNAKKKTTPASALRLAWQKQRRPDMCDAIRGGWEKQFEITLSAQSRPTSAQKPIRWGTPPFPNF